MNFKKIAGIAVSTAVFLGTTVPAFADFDFDFTLRQKSWLYNKVKSSVTTGGNTVVAGDDVEGGSITSGMGGVLVGLTNVVNSFSLPCDCLSGVDLDEDGEAEVYIKQKSGMKNKVYSRVNTGGNTMVAGDDVEGGSITSGDGGVDVTVTNVVNTFGEALL